MAARAGQQIRQTVFWLHRSRLHLQIPLETLGGLSARLAGCDSLQYRISFSMNAPSQMPLELSCTEVRGQLDRGEEFLLLDCREEAEFAHVRIEGATLLPMSEIQQRAGELEEWKGRPVVVYCHHGGRSLQVTHWLRQQGWESTQSMAGGIDAWAVEIDPALPRY